MSRTPHKPTFCPFQPQNRLIFNYHLLTSYLPFQTFSIPAWGVRAGAAVNVESGDGGWRSATDGEGGRREGLQGKCREKSTDWRGEWEPWTGRGHETQPQF